MPYRQTDTISLSAKEMVAFLLRQGMSREALLNALSELAPEKVKTTDSSFPSATLAADLIPEYEDERGNICKWEMVEDVPPSEFQISDLKFLSFLKKEDKGRVSGETMRQRAVGRKANFGLADLKRVLEHQTEIPVEFQNNYLVFPGTLLRVPDGCLSVACLGWGRGRWFLGWGWLSGGWSGRGRLVRCK